MTIILLLIFALAIPNTLDEPPGWSNYKVESENKQYFAWVKSVEKEGINDPAEAEWYIEVFQKEEPPCDSTLIWTAKYEHDGYYDGILSNDGQYFVYVGYWFYADYNVVAIYKEGEFIAGIKGEAFCIPESKIVETESHALWLREYVYPHYNYVKKGEKQYLQIFTIDGGEYWVDCDDGELENRQ